MSTVNNNNTDFEVRSLDAMCVNEEEVKTPGWHNLKYLDFGVLLGIIIIKSEVISWYSMQEILR